MNYRQTLEYLYEQLPMFHRIGAAAYKADLNNTYAICELLNHPEKKIKSVHIAGTNGKGSTSHMLAAILQTAGYKTGLYTSPHLKDFRERIRINGKMIPEKNVTAFVEKYKVDFEKIEPSFFEWTVGLAFDYFVSEKVDIAVIETGLGGRLDSTNVITPELCIITNIGKDHMNLLGNSLKEIATEKAGIIKKNIPVVIGQSQHEVKDVFEQKAKEMSAALIFADEHFSATANSVDQYLQVTVSDNKHNTTQTFDLDLHGQYQQHNLITVLQAVEELNHSVWNISPQHVADALKKVKSLTGLQGRWQTILTSPLTICDVGHNEDGIKEVLKAVYKTPHSHLHIVLGVVSDKNIQDVLKILPANASYYFCKATMPRALDASILRDQAISEGLKGDSYPSVSEAVRTAQKQANSNDLVLITGSTFVVAEAL